MRALLKVPSVLIGTCQPAKLHAQTPSAFSARLNKPMLTCSPVAAIISSSRGSGWAEIENASSSRRFVSPAIAEGTTIICDLPDAIWQCAAQHSECAQQNPSKCRRIYEQSAPCGGLKRMKKYAIGTMAQIYIIKRGINRGK